MTKLNRLKIATISAVITTPIVFLILFLIYSTRMGDIQYLVYMFPLSMGLLAFSGDIDKYIFGFALVQFLIYIAIIASARTVKMLFVKIAFILAFHTLAIAFFFFFKP